MKLGDGPVLQLTLRALQRRWRRPHRRPALFATLAAALCTACALPAIEPLPQQRLVPPTMPPLATMTLLDDTVVLVPPLPALRAPEQHDREQAEAARARADAEARAREAAERAKRQPVNSLEGVRRQNHDRLTSLARCVRSNKAALAEARRLGQAPGDTTSRLASCQDELLQLMGRWSRKETPC